TNSSSIDLPMKDLFTDTFCKVCKAVLQFETQRVSHYKGKKHAQKVRHYIQMHGEKDERQEHCKQKKRDLVDKNNYCSLCNVSFTSPVVGLSHCLGKIHTKKLKQFWGDQAHMPAQRTECALNHPLQRKSLFLDCYCKLCCAPFNNPLMAHEHYNGKKHQRNEARKKILEELGDKAIPGEHTLGVGYYTCFVCNVIVTSIETYQAHVKSFATVPCSLYFHTFSLALLSDAK
uniref:U1-type domain-containing protein n=1 Tax=Calidris pygmaea TaxID=425635 RepID=A0A8C3K0Q5_9CHAR